VDAEFARRLGDTPKIVATRGGQELGWRNVERTDDLLGAVAALRERPGLGKVLVPGSLSVVRQLLAAGQLDELRLLVHPVAARHGARLFAEDAEPLALTLLSSAVFPTGVIRLVYAPGAFPRPATGEDGTEHVPGADA
jgi:dihydrofolate reductase